MSRFVGFQRRKIVKAHDFNEKQNAKLAARILFINMGAPFFGNKTGLRVYTISRAT